MHVDSISYAGMTRDDTAYCLLCSKYSDHKHVSSPGHRQKVLWHKTKVLVTCLPYTELEQDYESARCRVCKVPFWSIDHLLSGDHIAKLRKSGRSKELCSQDIGLLQRFFEETPTNDPDYNFQELNGTCQASGGWGRGGNANILTQHFMVPAPPG